MRVYMRQAYDQLPQASKKLHKKLSISIIIDIRYLLQWWHFFSWLKWYVKNISWSKLILLKFDFHGEAKICACKLTTLSEQNNLLWNIYNIFVFLKFPCMVYNILNKNTK